MAEERHGLSPDHGLTRTGKRGRHVLRVAEAGETKELGPPPAGGRIERFETATRHGGENFEAFNLGAGDFGGPCLKGLPRPAPRELFQILNVDTHPR